MLDPPYSEQEARELYGTKHASMAKLLREAARVVRPGGHVLLYHRQVYRTHVPAVLQLVALVAVLHARTNQSLRALQVWRKREQLPGAVA